MAETLLDQTPVLGGAGTIYQRREGGSWYLYFWVKSERKRFRQSLETTDKALAIRTAEKIVLDALAKQQAGQKVWSATIAEVIDKWEVLQQDRLNRGEIRSKYYVRHLASVFRKQLGGCYGLQTPISALKQEDWDRYITFRGNQGVALDTIRVEVSHIRGLIGKVGLKLGADSIPDFKLHVPQIKRSRRVDTFAPEEFHSLIRALEHYVLPDSEDGLYERDWGLGAAKARENIPRSVNQDLEKSRRELLRYFVLVAASSGCRPHELAGEEIGSLRWRDVELMDLSMDVAVTRPAPTKKTIAVLHIREKTKTGQRSVPMAGGEYLREMREWSRYSGPDDFVFCDQFGIRAGKAVYMDSLRLHWHELLRRIGFDRFKPDLYTLRHYFATQRLKAGVPPFLVAKTLGHSIQELLRVYEHVLMGSEEVIRKVWIDETPKELKDEGLTILDELLAG